MRIIPAIDLIGGKCVRLSQGNYSKKTTYSESPVDIAKSYEDIGVKYLHLVDLDGAKAKTIVNGKVLESICSNTNLKVDFGGGVRTDVDVQLAFDCGAAQITAGSVAAKNPRTVYSWIEKFGAEKIILGADVKKGKLALNGWQELVDMDLFEFIKIYRAKGMETVISTDVATDGMLSGPSLKLYQKIMSECPGLNLVASGGVAQMSDIYKLEEMGLDGVIIGKAIYEGKITLKQLESYVN